MRNVPSVIPCVRLIGVSYESADWLEEFGAQLVESTGALAVCSFHQLCSFIYRDALMIAINVNSNKNIVSKKIVCPLAL